MPGAVWIASAGQHACMACTDMLCSAHSQTQPTHPVHDPIACMVDSTNKPCKRLLDRSDNLGIRSPVVSMLH